MIPLQFLDFCSSDITKLVFTLGGGITFSLALICIGIGNDHGLINSFNTVNIVFYFLAKNNFKISLTRRSQYKNVHIYLLFALLYISPSNCSWSSSTSAACGTDICSSGADVKLVSSYTLIGRHLALKIVRFYY